MQEGLAGIVGHDRGQGGQTRRNRHLVRAEAQAGGAQEGGCGVQRGRQPRRLDYRGAAAGLEESQAVIPANLVFGSDALVELDQVGTAAQQNVLAIVHDLASARVLVGRGPASQVWTPVRTG